MQPKEYYVTPHFYEILINTLFPCRLLFFASSLFFLYKKIIIILQAVRIQEPNFKPHINYKNLYIKRLMMICSKSTTKYFKYMNKLNSSPKFFLKLYNQNSRETSKSFQQDRLHDKAAIDDTLSSSIFSFFFSL